MKHEEQKKDKTNEAKNRNNDYPPIADGENSKNNPNLADSTNDGALPNRNTDRRAENKYNDDETRGNSDQHMNTTDKKKSYSSTRDIFENRRLGKYELNHYLDFDDMLPIIGEFGTYQKYLFILMIPFMVFTAFIYLGQIFMTLVPQNHWCFIPKLNSLPKDKKMNLSIPRDANGNFEKCLMYDTDYNELAGNPNAVVNTSWPTTLCKYGWTYDFKDVPYHTIATEYHWVCNKDKLPTYALAIYFLGSIFGCMLYGYLADNIGRVPALVSANIMACAGGIATSVSHNFLTFSIARFIVGLSFDSCYTLMYIILLEYVGPTYRTFVGNMSLGLFYTPSSCLVPWVAILCANWRKFALLTSIPMVFTVLIQCLIPESARWFVSNGHIDEAIEILRNIAKINNANVPSEVFERFRHCCQHFYVEERSIRSHTIVELFTSLHLCRVTILLIIIWMSTALMYDGHVRAINNVGTDIFIIFTIASATELPADILLVLTLDECGRRWCAFINMVICGVLSLLAAHLHDTFKIAVVAIVGRFFVNIAYNIGLQYAAEILPTILRAQGMAFIHIMGYVATLGSPFVVYLSNITPTLPFIILGSFGIVGGILCLFLPETLNRDLPQTVSDGKLFIKNQNIFESPCCASNSRYRHSKKRNWHSGSSLRENIPATYRSRQLARITIPQTKQLDFKGNHSDSDEDAQNTHNEELQKTHIYRNTN